MEIFWVIAILVMVIFFSSYWENLITLPEYLIWKRKMKDIHNLAKRVLEKA